MRSRPTRLRRYLNFILRRAASTNQLVADVCTPKRAQGHRWHFARWELSHRRWQRRNRRALARALHPYRGGRDHPAGLLPSLDAETLAEVRRFVLVADLTRYDGGEADRVASLIYEVWERGR